MAERFRVVLLFGYPGSGKGTQGKVLGRLPGFLHLAMGDIFRALDKESELGRESASYSSQGKLVPDELTMRIWRAHVDGMIEAGTYRPGGNLLLLDGIPRTSAQAKLLDDTIEVQQIVHLVLRDKEVVFERLRARASKEGRKDDADEAVIQTRLDTYLSETFATLGHYPKGKVLDIDAQQSPIEVLRDMASALIEREPQVKNVL